MAQHRSRTGLIALLVAVAVLTGCGGSEYDPDQCAFWTDMHRITETGTSRVEMDRYCTR